MIVRLWRATVMPGREMHYDAFARDVSRPMFEQQNGFQGVVFSRSGEHCLVVTLWADYKSVDALTASPVYGATVERISALLHPETTTEVYEVRGGAFPGGGHFPGRF